MLWFKNEHTRHCINYWLENHLIWEPFELGIDSEPNRGLEESNRETPGDSHHQSNAFQNSTKTPVSSWLHQQAAAPALKAIWRLCAASCFSAGLQSSPARLSRPHWPLINASTREHGANILLHLSLPFHRKTFVQSTPTVVERARQSIGAEARGEVRRLPCSVKRLCASVWRRSEERASHSVSFATAWIFFSLPASELL